MLELSRILSLFSLFTDLEPEVAERYRRFCVQAKEYVERRLLPDVDLQNDSHMEALCLAAAARAYRAYDMLQSSHSSGSDEVRVGDISLKASSVKEKETNALEIQEYFMAEASHLLQCPAQVFWKVDAL